MKKALVTAVLISVAALRVGAQSPLGLAYPLGVPDLSAAGASAAMGGAGTAVVNEYLGAGANPANAAIPGRSVFSALVSYDATSVSDGGGSSAVSGYMPKLLSLIVPIGVAGNLSFAMQKRCDATLNFYTRGEQRIDATAVNSATIEVHRSGGLTAWQAGWAYRFGNGVGVGVIYERLYFARGSRDVFESAITYSLDSGVVKPYQTTLTDSASVAFANDGFRLGTQIPVHEKVTLGFAGEFVLPGRGNGTEARAYRRSDDTAAAAVLSGEFSATLPHYMSIGAAYALSDQWLFAADAFFTLWEFYENELEAGNADRGLGLSVGARYIPAANALSAKYWEKVHYSAGVRFATLPNDKKFDRALEYALSVGAGLPIPRDGGMVDIVVSFGRRSDPRYSGYEENVVKLQLGLSGGRNWFQKDASKDY